MMGDPQDMCECCASVEASMSAESVRCVCQNVKLTSLTPFQQYGMRQTLVMWRACLKRHMHELITLVSYREVDKQKIS